MSAAATSPMVAGLWAATVSLSAPGWSQVADGSEPDADLLTLRLRPEHLSTPILVHLRAGPARPVCTWLDAGYQVTGYDGSGLGPGLQCVAEQQGVAGGHLITVIAAQYLFTSGEEMVVVSVDPALQQTFMHAFTGLHELLGTLQVWRPDGSEFHAGAVPGYTADTRDTWTDIDLGRGGEHR